jgi:hypothetical protein
MVPDTIMEVIEPEIQTQTESFIQNDQLISLENYRRSVTMWPNRYSTIISVECYEDSILRRIQWFTDIQMAYIWIHKKVQELQDEDWNILTFKETADGLDYNWANGIDYIRVADSFMFEYVAYYEPGAVWDRMNEVG